MTLSQFQSFNYLINSFAYVNGYYEKLIFVNFNNKQYESQNKWIDFFMCICCFLQIPIPT